MAKKTRASGYTEYIQFYEQVVAFDPEEVRTISEWKPIFKRWAKVHIIFREQLESLISGAQTLRDRVELTLRYTDKISSTMRFEYRGNFYNISIVGDKTGKQEEIGILGEAVVDGGE